MDDDTAGKEKGQWGGNACSGFMHQCKGARVYEEVAEDGTELFMN